MRRLSCISPGLLISTPHCNDVNPVCRVKKGKQVLQGQLGQLQGLPRHREATGGGAGEGCRIV